MEFIQGDQSKKYTYKYVGKKILTYKKGNQVFATSLKRQMRTLDNLSMFSLATTISPPVKAEHFHIFFGGTSQEALFEEMDNWPTYYPDGLSGQEIAQEMLAH